MNKSALVTTLFAIPVSIFAWTFFALSTGESQAIDPAENRPGGDTTVSIRPHASFMLPAANLAAEHKPDFHAGKALAHQPWVKAPTVTDARDGLGPLFNARTCLFCHVNGGRGMMPESSDQRLFANFLRLSIPGEDPVHGVVPDPVYGDQLQSQSTALAHLLHEDSGASYDADSVVAEGYVHIKWQTSTFTYADGHSVELREPQISISELGYGELHPDVRIGIRNAPPLHGVGLLENIAQSDIDRLADPHDRDGDGISGRVNTVWDFERKRTVPGRFGLKANKPDVRHQTAAALLGDMGISNPVFPQQPCTPSQTACLNQVHGNDPETGLEINDKLLGLMVDFTLSLGVPERRKPDHPLVLQGRKLFYQAQCQGCHHPDYVTVKNDAYPHLSQQRIWPYTDLLLHDMGPGLGDGRPDYLASGTEWRTPPLWGVGLSQAVNGSKQYLHDGRARSVEEAILWHGGEAGNSRQYFINLQEDKRKALIAFVKSL